MMILLLVWLGAADGDRADREESVSWRHEPGRWVYTCVWGINGDFVGVVIVAVRTGTVPTGEETAATGGITFCCGFIHVFGVLMLILLVWMGGADGDRADRGGKPFRET